MVDQDENGYRCEECGMHYTDRKTAVLCEQFCREHGACSTDIVDQSIESS